MALKKKRLLTFVLILFSSLSTYVVCEIAYRIFQYRNLKNAAWGYLAVEKPLYESSPSGYRYRPRLDLTAHWVSDTFVERRTRLRTNNYGLVSDYDLPARKAPGEFRIAILGDSLTACIHNNVRWTDLLQDALNRSPAIKQKFHARKITVLNLGLDGLGLPQMPAVLRERFAELDPDLVVVNFITADIYRRATWRTLTQFPDSRYPYQFLLGCTDQPASLANPNCEFSNVLTVEAATYQNPEAMAGIRAEISTAVAKRKNWFTPYPEFLSYLMQGNLEKWLGQNPYLPISSTISDRDESLRLSAEAIRQIAREYPQTVFTLLPTYWEIVHNVVPKLAAELIESTPEIPITPLIGFLPQTSGQASVNPWINYPYDMHWSDLGAEIIAESMQGFMEGLSPTPKDQTRG